MALIFLSSAKTCVSLLQRGCVAQTKNRKRYCGSVSMSEETEKSTLERIAEILISEGVEFIVVGGQAEWLFGSPRATFDVDLCYRRTKENLKRLAQALRKIRPSLRNA